MSQPQQPQIDLRLAGKYRKIEMLFSGLPLGNVQDEVWNWRFPPKPEDDIDTTRNPLGDVDVIELRTRQVLGTDSGPYDLVCDDNSLYERLPQVHHAVSWLLTTLVAEQLGEVSLQLFSKETVQTVHVAPTQRYREWYDQYFLVLRGMGYLSVGKEQVKFMPGECYWFYNLDDFNFEPLEDQGPCELLFVDLKLRGDKTKLRNGECPPITVGNGEEPVLERPETASLPDEENVESNVVGADSAEPMNEPIQETATDEAKH